MNLNIVAIVEFAGSRQIARIIKQFEFEMKQSPLIKPTRADLEAANDKTIPDVIGPNLQVLFCGINPSLYSAAIEHHFGRPGNRFWPSLHQSGFTPRLYTPFEDEQLLSLGLGVTNVVNRATARADQLSRDELLVGGGSLRKKIQKYKPLVLAVLGIGAYRTAFEQPNADWHEQPESIGNTRVWILPNPSGLNANFQLPDLVREFALLKDRVEQLAATR